MKNERLEIKIRGNSYHGRVSKGMPLGVDVIFIYENDSAVIKTITRIYPNREKERSLKLKLNDEDLENILSIIENIKKIQDPNNSVKNKSIQVRIKYANVIVNNQYLEIKKDDLLLKELYKAIKLEKLQEAIKKQNVEENRLTSENSILYKQTIEQVMPGFFSRVKGYFKSIDETQDLLGKDYMNSLHNLKMTFSKKIDKRENVNLVHTFLNRVKDTEGQEFASLVKSNQIIFDKNIRLGKAIYDPKTKGTTITIQDTNTLMDASSLIHEFMHYKTNKFSGTNLRDMAENKKFQEELSIFIELCFIKFLLGFQKYKADAEILFKYRIKNALLSSPGELQNKMMALYYADNNRPQEDFEKRFGKLLPIVIDEIKKNIPPSIEDYYIGTMSALDNMKGGNETDKLMQIFKYLDNNDFNKVKEIMPMSYNRSRDAKNIIEFLKNL